MNDLRVRPSATRAMLLEYVLPVEPDTMVWSVRHVQVVVMVDANLALEHVSHVILDLMDLSVISSVKDARILVVTKTEPATNAYSQMNMD